MYEQAIEPHDILSQVTGPRLDVPRHRHGIHDSLPCSDDVRFHAKVSHLAADIPSSSKYHLGDTASSGSTSLL